MQNSAQGATRLFDANGVLLGSSGNPLQVATEESSTPGKAAIVSQAQVTQLLMEILDTLRDTLEILDRMASFSGAQVLLPSASTNNNFNEIMSRIR